MGNCQQGDIGCRELPAQVGEKPRASRCVVREKGLLAAIIGSAFREPSLLPGRSGSTLQHKPKRA
jgi:hypothetical protein